MPLNSLSRNEFKDLCYNHSLSKDRTTDDLIITEAIGAELAVMAFKQDLDNVPVYIAGGALRDAVIGRVPKDYDVFILSTGDEEQDDFANLIPSCLPDSIDLNGPAPSFGEDNSKPKFRVTKKAFDGNCVDCVFRPERTVEDLLNDFDHDLVRLAYDVHNDKYLVDQRFLDAINPDIKTVLTSTRRTSDLAYKAQDFFKVHNISVLIKNKKTKCKNLAREALIPTIWPDSMRTYQKAFDAALKRI